MEYYNRNILTKTIKSIEVGLNYDNYWKRCRKYFRYKWIICWVEFKKLYDISVQNQEHTQIIEYNVVKELSDIQKTYFNLLKGETYEDEHGNIVKCISHSIEYGL